MTRALRRARMLRAEYDGLIKKLELKPVREEGAFTQNRTDAEALVLQFGRELEEWA